MSEVANVPSLRFAAEDVELFGGASHDLNPLHLSEDYARRTPFGRPVVFGILAALASLGRVGPRAGLSLSTLRLEFRMPVFADVDYAIDSRESSLEQVDLALMDGPQVVMRVTATFRQGEPDRVPAEPILSVDTLAESLDRQSVDLVPGLTIEGGYAPEWKLAAALMQRLRLQESGLGASHVAALLCASYLVGMQLPGRRALFVRLSLQFRAVAQTNEPIAYLARVRTMERRSHLMTADVRFGGGETDAAVGEIVAQVRQDVPPLTLQMVESVLPRSEALVGKLGLVIGASRGLGAALCLSLASQGCTVLASFHKSGAEAQRLQDAASAASGRIQTVRGDAADLAWCEELRGLVERDFGRLDFLICNAAPALLPMRLHPRSVSRVDDYVAESLRLVSVPVAVFLPLVSTHAGWLVTISSSAVGAPPADWPHYVSAKFAVEGLTRAAAADQRAASYLIARPPRLRTELLNTPLGHEGASPPERVAARIVQQLMGPPGAGRVQMLEAF